MNPIVILIHGLWLRAWTLGRLGAQLRKSGYECRRFDYASISRSQKPALESLADFIGECPTPPHLVGHSLGGMLAVETLRKSPELPTGRVVCLGSPLAGSQAAAAMAAKSGLRRLLGHYSHLLADGLECVPEGREVGVIAGRLGVGLGRVFGAFDGPHDGTVAVAETRIPGLADHCTVAASHSGLLISADAARQTSGFLSCGRFAGGTSAGDPS
jgi:pimeloyl-ACP methyl ester carboxylesterase